MESGLTEAVIGAAFEVSNTLGTGFLEKVYERALVRELGEQGIRVESQVPFSVFYKGHCVGEYFAAILVEGELVVELKCVERLSGEHIAQCLNYLKASGKIHADKNTVIAKAYDLIGIRSLANRRATAA